MKKLLIGSIALLAAGLLTLAGFLLLGPDNAVAQETEDPKTFAEYHFGPLDEVLDELVDETVIDVEQADAIRRRMGEKMSEGFLFEGKGPHGPMGFGFMGDGFRMEGFLDQLPEDFTPPPGPPGTPEFDAWLDEMKQLMGDGFFGGHMFRFDGEVPEHGLFPHGPGMMGDGYHQFRGFGDLNIDDLQGFIEEMTERFDGEIPERMQDMIDHLREQLSDTTGAETSFDA